jgi:hypothetical protein
LVIQLAAIAPKKFIAYLSQARVVAELGIVGLAGYTGSVVDLG